MKTMPDVPTLKEKGVDLSIGTWRGLIVSQKTPQDVEAAPLPLPGMDPENQD